MSIGIKVKRNPELKILRTCSKSFGPLDSALDDNAAGLGLILAASKCFSSLMCQCIFGTRKNIQFV